MAKRLIRETSAPGDDIHYLNKSALGGKGAPLAPEWPHMGYSDLVGDMRFLIVDKKV